MSTSEESWCFSVYIKNIRKYPVFSITISSLPEYQGKYTSKGSSSKNFGSNVEIFTGDCVGYGNPSFLYGHTLDSCSSRKLLQLINTVKVLGAMIKFIF